MDTSKLKKHLTDNRDLYITGAVVLIVGATLANQTRRTNSYNLLNSAKAVATLDNSLAYVKTMAAEVKRLESLLPKD